MNKQRNCGLRIVDCGLNGKSNSRELREAEKFRATLKRTRLGVLSEDVGATSRAASVSASGTPTGGYLRPKTATDLSDGKLSIVNRQLSIEQQQKKHTGKMPVRRMGGTPMPRCRRGVILVVAMWIVLVLAGLVLTLARAMQTENVCSANEYAAAQADAVEQGAIQYVLAHVDSQYGKFPADADMPCEAVRIGDGAFWIIRNNDTANDTSPVFGLTDESARLNLNTATQNMLMMLPDMTEELAAGIIDWRDADSNTATNGAESDYYLVQPDPYQCKNGPLETVDELYLIKGASADIIEGEDINLNGVMDAGEDAGGDGRLDRGFYPFVTVYSSTAATDSTGAARINVNSAGQTLRNLLTTNFSAGRVNTVMGQIQRNRPFQSVLDFYVRCGLTADEFKLIADKITTATGAQKGLINVNTAPKEVLACIPGLTDTDVAALIAKRSETNFDQTNIAWVASALTPAKARAIGRYVTTQAYQFSADIVSVAENGRAFRRCRVVIDASTSPPKIIYRQDMTQLGWPLSQDILTKLRAGAGLDNAVQAVPVRQEVVR